MISAPPFELGADQVTSRVPLLGVSVSSVGLVGVVRGVADNELESSEFPKLLVATMVTVYSTPLVSPVTVHVSEVVVQVVVVVPSVTLTV